MVVKNQHRVRAWSTGRREPGASAHVAAGTQPASLSACDNKLLEKVGCDGEVEGLCLSWKGEQKAEKKKQGPCEGRGNSK